MAGKAEIGGVYKGATRLSCRKCSACCCCGSLWGWWQLWMSGNSILRWHHLKVQVTWVILLFD